MEMEMPDLISLGPPEAAQNLPSREAFRVGNTRGNIGNTKPGPNDLLGNLGGHLGNLGGHLGNLGGHLGNLGGQLGNLLRLRSDPGGESGGEGGAKAATKEPIRRDKDKEKEEEKEKERAGERTKDKQGKEGEQKDGRGEKKGKGKGKEAPWVMSGTGASAETHGTGDYSIRVPGSTKSVLKKPTTPQNRNRNLREAHNDEQLRAFLLEGKAAKRPVVVKYGASWCHACSKMLPTFFNLSNEYSSPLFVYADVDKCATSTQDIRYTPTFRFFRDGEKVDEFYGAGPQRLRDRVWLQA